MSRPALTARIRTKKGQFALGGIYDVADCVAAVATGVARKVAGVRPVLPWYTFPAMRFIRARVTPSTRVFEWSCGMSTLWFERRCSLVWAVEDDRAWRLGPRSLSEYPKLACFEHKLLRFRLRGPQHAAPKMISRTGS